MFQCHCHYCLLYAHHGFMCFVLFVSLCFPVFFCGFSYMCFFFSLFCFFICFVQSSEEGAVAPIYCAVSEELEGVTGKYFDSDCSLVLPAPLARDPALAVKDFEVCERLTSKLWSDNLHWLDNRKQVEVLSFSGTGTSVNVSDCPNPAEDLWVYIVLSIYVFHFLHFHRNIFN